MKIVLCVLLSVLAVSEAEVLSNCELVLALKSQGVPDYQIPTWVCIASKESSMNTGAVSQPEIDGSKNYGIFQINSRYWCAGGAQSMGDECGVSCESLLDNDVSNDIQCAQLIYQQKGFSAWTTYGAPGCDENNNLDSYNNNNYC